MGYDTLKLSTGDRHAVRVLYADEVRPYKGEGANEARVSLEMPDGRKMRFYGNLALIEDLRGLGIVTDDGRASDKQGVVREFMVRRGKPPAVLEKADAQRGRAIRFLSPNGDAAPAARGDAAPSGQPTPAPAVRTPRELKQLARRDWIRLREATRTATEIAAAALQDACGVLHRHELDQGAVQRLTNEVLVAAEKWPTGSLLERTYGGMLKRGGNANGSPPTAGDDATGSDEAGLDGEADDDLPF